MVIRLVPQIFRISLAGAEIFADQKFASVKTLIEEVINYIPEDGRPRPSKSIAEAKVDFPVSSEQVQPESTILNSIQMTSRTYNENQ